MAIESQGRVLSRKRSRIGRTDGSSTDADQRAAQLLGQVALLFAALFVAITLLRVTVHAAGIAQNDPVPVTTGAVLNGGFAALCLAMNWATRKLRPTVALALGLKFEVALCLGGSLAELSIVDISALPPRLAYINIIWFTLPLIVPTGLRQRVITTVLCWATIPVAMAFWTLMGTDFGPPDIMVRPLIVNGVTAVVAVLSSRVVHRLQIEAREARRMGSYELIEKIGSGGMGEVWRAKHRMLARPAAVKLIRRDTDGQGDVSAQLRFEREAQTTANLRSPHTVQLYDFGVTPDGVRYFAMELLDGLDLDTLVTQFGPMHYRRALTITEHVCRSLAEAHQADLVHRDVKPANIFLTRLGTHFDFAKVLDFGLVKPRRAEPNTVKLSHADAMTGTPAFVAPEQAVGKGELDGRGDIYSLGCVLYFLLTGELVFEATGAVQMMLAHVQSAPEPPSTRTELVVPPEVDALVLKCLEKDPNNRPADADEVRRSIAQILRREPWTDAEAQEWWTEHAPHKVSTRVRSKQ